MALNDTKWLSKISQKPPGITADVPGDGPSPGITAAQIIPAISEILGDSFLSGFFQKKLFFFNF